VSPASHAFQTRPGRPGTIVNPASGLVAEGPSPVPGPQNRPRTGHLEEGPREANEATAAIGDFPLSSGDPKVAVNRRQAPPRAARPSLSLLLQEDRHLKCPQPGWLVAPSVRSGDPPSPGGHANSSQEIPSRCATITAPGYGRSVRHVVFHRQCGRDAPPPPREDAPETPFGTDPSRHAAESWVRRAQGPAPTEPQSPVATKGFDPGTSQYARRAFPGAVERPWRAEAPPFVAVDQAVGNSPLASDGLRRDDAPGVTAPPFLNRWRWELPGRWALGFGSASVKESWGPEPTCFESPDRFETPRPAAGSGEKPNPLCRTSLRVVHTGVRSVFSFLLFRRAATSDRHDLRSNRNPPGLGRNVLLGHGPRTVECALAKKTTLPGCAAKP